jgi:hypothetical protein
MFSGFGGTFGSLAETCLTLLLTQAMDSQKLGYRVCLVILHLSRAKSTHARVAKLK